MTHARSIFLRVAFAFLALFPAVALAGQEETAGAINEALRIRVNGKTVLGEADLQQKKFADEAAAMAEFRKNIVSVQRNASVQLAVETIDARGRSSNVTANPATTYQSLAPSRLTVSAGGLVTAAPAPDAPMGLGGDLAVLVLFENQGQQAWNKVFFNILP